MSLAVLADHMASKGRGGDSMLIHMAPQEVAGLQALAMAHGGSLTINPDTGLPEALSLKKLLPAIIGFGITAMTGIPAWQVGLGVGAVETARTGDLGKGISAGLGAYGGAGLGASFTAAPVAEMAGSQIASQAVDQAALEGIQLPSNYAEMAAKTATPDQLMAARDSMSFGDLASKGATNFTNDPSKFATKDNFKYLAAAASPILADQAVKSSMPQTVTKPGAIRPYSYDPYGGGFTAYPEYEVPKRAASGGIMGFDESANSPMSRQSLSNMQDTGGMFNYAHDGGSVMRMAEGGIAGYAGGDIPGYAGGMLVGDQDVFDYFKGLDQSKLGSGALDTKIANDMQTFNVSAADIARITGQQGQQGNFEQRFVQAINPATLNSADFLAKTADVGLTDQALVNAMQGAGMSTAAQYAATHTLDDTAGISSAPKAAQDFYSAYGYKTGDAPGDKGGLAGLYTNIDYAADQLQAKIDAGALTVAQAQNLSLAEMERLGINQADIKAATGSDFATLFKPKTVVKDTITGGGGNDTIVGGGGNDVITTGLTCGEGMEPNAAGTACVPKKVTTTQTKTCEVGYHLSANGLTCIKDAPVIIDYKDCGTGYHWDKAAQACVVNTNAVQTAVDTVDTPTSIATAADTALPVGVSGAGITTINPNGTVTTRPDIPGIPDDGFTGMTSLRKAYTDGGGSLGYIPYAPKTMAEFNTKYNNLTGGSKQAYDYLTGKTPYSPTPFTPTGQIFKPYSEAMGIPQDLNKRRYLFDPVTKTYKVNPDYKPPAYSTAGIAATAAAALVNPDKQPTDDPGAGNKWTWSDVDKKWSATPIDGSSGNASSESSSGTGGDAAGGLMRKAEGGLAALTMAHGGMAEQFNLGGYSDGGRLLRGPGDGVSDSIPATIGNKRPARLADGEFVVPARIVSELGNGSTEAGARKLYAMMDRVQAARKGSIGKGKVANNSRADKYLPA